MKLSTPKVNAEQHLGVHLELLQTPARQKPHGLHLQQLIVLLRGTDASREGSAHLAAETSPQQMNLSRRKIMCDHIDAVVTWVDSSCPTWQAMRARHAPNEGDSRFPPPESPDAEVELCISLILKHLPWVRILWLVTMRPQTPKCLSRPEFEGRVKVIHHDEIMPTSHLPTFNSQAIEANLWKIPLLAERFVYFNDDVYVLKSTSPDVFFKLRKPIAWPSKPVPSGWKNDSCMYKTAWCNLAREHKGARLLHHVPLSLTKTILSDAANHFENLWNDTSSSRGKGATNIPPIGAAINLAIRNGTALFEKKPKTLMKETVIKPKTVSAILKKEALFLCVNRQPFHKTKAFCEEMKVQLLT